MRYAIVLGLLLIGQGVVWADDNTPCPPGSFTRVIGAVSTGNDTTGTDAGVHNIREQGGDVRRITVGCAGTACVATLYDSDGTAVGDTDAADVKAEPGCPANQACNLDFDPPLQFTEGITFHDDGNVNSTILYECR